MTWTASVQSRTFEAGMVKVVVVYTDGARTLTETYQAVQPTATWIPETVRDRLALLETAGAFDVAVGAVTPAVPRATPDAVASLFQRRIRALQDVNNLIALGVVPPTHPKVVALKDWLTANLSAYFDTLTG